MIMIHFPLLAAFAFVAAFLPVDEGKPTAAPLAFELGGESPVLQIPRDEHLTFSVHVEVGPLGATVGEVHIDSGVDEYIESMLVMAPPKDEDNDQPKRETGWLRAKATGDYLWYELNTTLDTRYLPSEWPRISHFYRQSGSENRRRSSRIGIIDSKQVSIYRGDTSRGAVNGQRVWRDPETREMPAGAIDMLGAVFLSRTLLEDENVEELVFPLLDKTKLWKMTLKRGVAKRVTVPLGTFDAIEIMLIPSTWPGEPKAEAAKFRGLFGIRGSIHLWVEKNTGVPIRIVGSMPAGPTTIDCDIALTSAEGTPAAFKAIAAAAK